MLQNKNIVLKYTPAALCAEVLSFALIITILLLVTAMYPDMPDYSAGQNTGDMRSVRETALLQPILAVFLYMVLTGIGIIIRKLAPANDPKGILAAVCMLFLYMKAVYLLYAAADTYFTLSSGKTPVWAVLFLPIALIFTVVTSAAVIVKRYKNKKTEA